jgi:hypothetical protein
MPLRILLVLAVLGAPWLVHGCASQGGAVDGGEPAGLRFGPKELLYPVYLADPRRPTFAVTPIYTSDSDIEEAGDRRYGIRMGARIPFARYGVEGRRVGSFQLDGEIGFLGEFDRDSSTDNIGWDGIYGLFLTWRATEDLAFLVGAKHDSSHIGDELIESTGRTRVDYTREELVAGLSYELSPLWRTYAEYGRAYDLRNDAIMERGRVQAGLEIVSRPTLFGGRFAPYGALDVTLYEENDWRRGLTLQSGVLRRTEARAVWRFGVELRDGRSAIGEFFQDDEESLAFGAWLDL